MKNDPTFEELGSIRQGAELQNMKPYIDSEIASMQKAVVSSVLVAVNNGALTPEIAMSKWMEYIAYHKMGQRVDQKIAVGMSIGSGKMLDFSSKIN